MIRSFKRSTRLAAAIAVATALIPGAAHAGSRDGHWQAKLFMSGVLPDGHVTRASGPAAAALNGSDVKGSDNWVPTLALEYFISDRVSVETICCATGHHMYGTGALAGTPLVEKMILMPFTVTAKVHFELGGVRPYVGAGPALVVFARKQPSAAVKGLGLTQVGIPAKPGVALQAGVDVPLGDNGFSFSLDAKRYFVRPTASFKDAGGTVQLRTTHKLDPLVVSAGLGYRF